MVSPTFEPLSNTKTEETCEEPHCEKGKHCRRLSMTLDSEPINVASPLIRNSLQEDVICLESIPGPEFKHIKLKRESDGKTSEEDEDYSESIGKTDEIDASES